MVHENWQIWQQESLENWPARLPSLRSVQEFLSRGGDLEDLQEEMDILLQEICSEGTLICTPALFTELVDDAIVSAELNKVLNPPRAS